MKSEILRRYEQKQRMEEEWKERRKMHITQGTEEKSSATKESFKELDQSAIDTVLSHANKYNNQPEGDITEGDNVRKFPIYEYVRLESGREVFVSNYPNLIAQGYPKFSDWLKDNPEFLTKRRAGSVLANMTKTVPSRFRKQIGMVDYLSVIAGVEPSYKDYNNEINKLIDILENRGFVVKSNDYRGQGRLGHSENSEKEVISYAVLSEDENRILTRLYKHTAAPKEYLENGVKFAREFCEQNEETKEFMSSLSEKDKDIAGILLLMKLKEEDCEKALTTMFEYEEKDRYNDTNAILDQPEFNLLTRNLTEIVKLYIPTEEKGIFYSRILNAVDYTNVLNKLIEMAENEAIKTALRDIRYYNNIILDEMEANQTDSEKQVKERYKELKMLKRKDALLQHYGRTDVIAQFSLNRPKRGLSW